MKEESGKLGLGRRDETSGKDRFVHFQRAHRAVCALTALINVVISLLLVTVSFAPVCVCYFT